MQKTVSNSTPFSTAHVVEATDSGLMPPQFSSRVERWARPDQARKMVRIWIFSFVPPTVGEMTYLPQPFHLTYYPPGQLSDELLQYPNGKYAADLFTMIYMFFYSNSYTLWLSTKHTHWAQPFLDYRKNVWIVIRTGRHMVRQIFCTREVAKTLIARWKEKYNYVRPQSSLGYRPLAPQAWLLAQQLATAPGLT